MANSPQLKYPVVGLTVHGKPLLPRIAHNCRVAEGAEFWLPSVVYPKKEPEPSWLNRLNRARLRPQLSVTIFPATQNRVHKMNPCVICFTVHRKPFKRWSKTCIDEAMPNRMSGVARCPQTDRVNHRPTGWS